MSRQIYLEEFASALASDVKEGGMTAKTVAEVMDALKKLKTEAVQGEVKDGIEEIRSCVLSGYKEKKLLK